jgi:hypothetical protein
VLRGTEAAAPKAYRAIVACESVATHAHSAFAAERRRDEKQTVFCLRTQPGGETAQILSMNNLTQPP